MNGFVCRAEEILIGSHLLDDVLNVLPFRKGGVGYEAVLTEKRCMK